MKLYHKELLAFAAVILIAVLAVALLVGQSTVTEFRNYTALYSNRTQLIADTLQTYYVQNGSWEGVQDALPRISTGRGFGRQGSGSTQVAGGWDFKVADARLNIVADSQGSPSGKLTSREVQAALPLSDEATLIGYLLPSSHAIESIVLDAPAQNFLDRLYKSLGLGGIVGFLAAMVLGGVLIRSILSPVRELMAAAESITQGNLESRAQVRGDDEIAELAVTFNTMAESLERAEQTRQAQTADIAHELRNPLMVLQGTLEALLDGVYEPTEENIEPALSQVRTLNRLVEDLRLLALADAGQLHMDFQDLDIGVLVHQVTEGYRGAFTERHIALQVSIPKTLPAIQGDYGRLTQVLNNILSNAVRYVTGGATVRVLVDSQAAGLIVSVIDNGPGVPDEMLPRLFERFWRGEPSRSRETGGSGLGLAIARHIIEAHKGRITAQSTPGGGLTINIWLPVK